MLNTILFTMEYQFFEPLTRETEFGSKNRSCKNLDQSKSEGNNFGSKNPEFQKIEGSDNRESTVSSFCDAFKSLKYENTSLEALFFEINLRA